MIVDRIHHFFQGSQERILEHPPLKSKQTVIRRGRIKVMLLDPKIKPCLPTIKEFPKMFFPPSSAHNVQHGVHPMTKPSLASTGLFQKPD